MMFRSTKGASKQRRDLINGEISQLRDLLPLAETARQRLSQLQIMSLTCCFIRKNNYFSKLFAGTSGTGENPFEFFQAMSGFLLITTKDGKLLYISENVTEFLGHSMVDMMTQGDSLYDIIDKRDHSTVQNQLLQGNYGNGGGIADEQTFFCRMNVSRSLRRQGGFGDHKVMHVRGHFIQPSLRDHYGNSPVFMACVSPLVTPDVKETIIQNNTMIFQSVHNLDMSFIELALNGEYHLGYNENELIRSSWYNYIHPEDIYEAKEKHSQLIKASHEMGCMLTIRFLKSDMSWVWINIVMHIRQPFASENGDPAIMCINHVIDESEVSHFKLQSQLYSSHIARSPEFLSNPPSSSPPHTITQIPMDSDQYQMQGYSGGGSLQTAGGYYQADFGITTVPLQSSNQGQVSTVGEPVPLTRMNIGSLSESSNDSSGSNNMTSLKLAEPKRVTRLELINRLKRKLPPQCKPIKKPKTVVNENNTDNLPEGDGGLSLFGSAVIVPSYQVENIISGERGDQQILLQFNNDRPVYAQLKKSMDLEIKDPAIYLNKLTKAVAPVSPAGPLTPDSLLSDAQSSTDFDSCSTALTIDVNPEVNILPPSILTPDASPVSSPQNSTAPVEAEQCVPSLIAEIENAIMKEEFGRQKFHQDCDSKKKVKYAQIKMKQEQQLPELDPMAIDSFFGGLDDLTKAIKAVSATDDILPKSEPSPLMDCEQVRSSSFFENTTTDPSPLNQSHNDVSGLQCDGDEEMFDLGELQLANIVANVAGSIMDMVQNTTASEADLTADFMLVPSDDHSSFAEVPVIKQEEEEEEMSPLHGELLNELHQLNQLAANSAPSYGDSTELVDAFFNQTL